MSRIADLMLEIGRARANGIAGAGQAYGQSVASLGNILRDYRQGKLQDQELALDRQFRTDQMTLAQNRDTREAADFDNAKKDRATAAAQLAHQRTLDHVGAVLLLPDPDAKQAAWSLLFTGADPRERAQIPEQYPGDQVAATYLAGEGYDLNKLRERSQPKPDLMSVNPGDVVINKGNPGAGAVFTAPPKPDTATKSMEQQLLDAEQAGNTPLAAQIRRVMNARDINMAPKDDSAVTLSPEGLDAAAMMFGKTGQLPPMGMGKAAADARTRIINRAAVLIPGLDIASAKADFAANQDSEKALQKQIDAVTSFEETATKNLDLFIKAAEKIPDSGSPLLNRPIRTLSDSLFGSPEMATFNAQRRTVIPEFAKILNNPNLSGQLSDSARHEIEEVMSGNATLKQMVATAKALVQDTTNRKTSMHQQLQAIRSRIKKGADAPAPSQGAPMVKPIPGIPGAEATSTDGGKTWTRSK